MRLKAHKTRKGHTPVHLAETPPVLEVIPAGAEAPRIETAEEFKLDFTSEHAAHAETADEGKLPGERTAGEEVIAPRNPME